MSVIFSIGVGFFCFFTAWILTFISLLLLGRLTIYGEGMGFLVVMVFGFIIATVVGIIGFVFGFGIGIKFWTKHFGSQPRVENVTVNKLNRKLLKLIVFLPFAAIAVFGTWFFAEFAFRNYIFNHKDPTMCYRLGNNPNDVNKCYVKKLYTADKYEYCFPERTTLTKEEESFCLLSVALNTNNPSICQEVTTGYSRYYSEAGSQNNCYERLIDKTKDISLCEKLTPTSDSPNIVDECKNQTY